MSAMTLEGWCKTRPDQKPTPLEDIHFFVSDADHLRLEHAEEYLQNSGAHDVMVDADLDNLDLKMPEGFGPLSDCQYRVYLSHGDQRGHFHLVGHRASDGSLIYTNAVLIDQLLG
ncbi:hypothetical protein ACYCAX_19040 [Pseudomonas sp. MT3]|uniref:hypothetical protein n=1 Tax=Pseudomonas sp. ATCC 13867 TaxID=1294143 RepID=UPI0002C4E2BE|nr:hypothetical protein [Pseudomonas sp. ATCC 13867]AGI23108.1 hypothetical protein H681_06140 [Pseudomonas sp. ATCC 13867]RFQ34569.1 hypothetical protein D0N87_10375 [Pseudomonas sp. ATCC 13867]